jgi:hypothetical protein
VRAALFITAALIANAGCGYTEMHDVVLRGTGGPTGRPVELYMMSQQPPRPFYEVALVQVIGHGSDANLEDLMKAVVKRGGELGCDAVVRVQFDQGYSMAHAFGVCVKWAAPPATAPPPAPPAPAPAPEPSPEPNGTGI